MRPSYPSKSLYLFGPKKGGNLVGLSARTAFQNGMGHVESPLPSHFQRNVEEHSHSFSSSVQSSKKLCLRNGDGRALKLIAHHSERAIGGVHLRSSLHCLFDIRAYAFCFPSFNDWTD